MQTSQSELLLEINGVQLLALPGAQDLNIFELRYWDYAGRVQRAIFYDYCAAEAEFTRAVEEGDYR